MAWTIDNNLTRKLSSADPVVIAMAKGLVAMHRRQAPHRYPMSIGSKGVAMVDARDIAEVAAIELIRRDQAPGKLPIETINLVGPDALTGVGVAAIWSDVLGRPVAYAGDDDTWDPFSTISRKAPPRIRLIEGM